MEQQAEEAHLYARSWNDSIVDDIFGGLLQSTIQCQACRCGSAAGASTSLELLRDPWRRRGCYRSLLIFSQQSHA